MCVYKSVVIVDVSTNTIQDVSPAGNGSTVCKVDATNLILD